MKLFKFIIFLILLFFLFETCSDNPIDNVVDNRPPKIIELTSEPDSLSSGQKSRITCNAKDPDNDQLEYVWFSEYGFFSGSGSSVTWTAPCIGGQIFIYCEVKDEHNGKARDRVAVYLKNEHPSDLPLHYYVVPTCYPTIQSAIDAAVDGDSVIVLPGTYYENLDMKGKNVFLSSLYGIDQDESYISDTIIDGQQSWTVIVINKGEDSTCVINGFTLVNGIGVDPAQSSPLGRIGGAIYCNNSSPKLMNLTISKNDARGGGAIYFSQAEAILDNVLISENTSHYGSVLISNCSPRFNNVQINQNIGPGLGVINCNKTIQNLVITNNSGAGVYCGWHNSVTLKNLLVAGNESSGFAGAFMHIVNSTCVNNGIGMACNESPNTVKNSIFFNNADKEIAISQIMSGYSGVSVQYSNIKGGPDCFELRGDSNYLSIDYNSTNFSTDPQFCDPDFGDYSLESTSPCVNRGENGGIVGAFGIGCD